MPETQNPTTQTPSSQGRKGDSPQGGDAGRAAAEAERRTFEEGAQAAREHARAAEAVAEKTADASHAAARANSEIFRAQIDTVQQAMRCGLDSSARNMEGLTQVWSRTFGLAAPNPDLAEQASQNVQAVADASRALAKGGQSASSAWFDLTQNAMRAQLDAFGKLVGCRSPQEVTAVQSELARTVLQHMIQSGEAMAQAASTAISDAGRAMQQAPQRPPQRGL